MDFVGFLSMVIYAVLYTQCLRYNICSAWFLDIRISTRFQNGQKWPMVAILSLIITMILTVC